MRRKSMHLSRKNNDLYCRCAQNIAAILILFVDSMHKRWFGVDFAKGEL